MLNTNSVLILGSGECDQLGLGDDAPLEIKKPRIIKTLTESVNVTQIA